MIARSWLVVRADGVMRILTRNPVGKLNLDEIAIPIVVDIPAAWGKVRQDGITVQMPEPPAVTEDGAA